MPDLARMIQNRDEIPEESLRFAETRHRVSRETLKAWSVSWDAEDGTFVFPRWAPDGLLEVVTKRAYREELMPNGCHWMDLPDCVPDPKRSLYGSHNVDLTSRRAIVAEGYWDTLYLRTLGYWNALGAISGAISPFQAAWLADRCDCVTWIPDGDTSGRHSLFSRGRHMLAIPNLDRIALPRDKDLDDLEPDMVFRLLGLPPFGIR